MKNACIACATLLIFLTFGCHESGSAPADTSGTQAKAGAPRNVRTEPVSTQPVTKPSERTGRVAFTRHRSSEVLSPISGPVSRILVGIGSRVTRGESLAVVASPDFAAAVSALRKAEATARNARRIEELDQQLFKNDAIARRDLEQAQTDAINADADRDSAVQQLRALGVEETTIGEIEQNKPVENLGGIIRSPINGTVVEKLVSPGQLLQAATTATFTVADLSSVWVMANVFEADLATVHVAHPPHITTAGAQTPPRR